MVIILHVTGDCESSDAIGPAGRRVSSIACTSMSFLLGTHTTDPYSHAPENGVPHPCPW
jgi:hypothetical protein